MGQIHVHHMTKKTKVIKLSNNTIQFIREPTNDK
jgi:hypothetical protein